jgi:hypothetical protein
MDLHSKDQGGYKPIPVPGVGRPPLPNDNWPYSSHPNDGFDPQYGIKNPKFNRHIYIRRDQIMYDLDAQIGIMAQARRKNDGTEEDTFSNATSKFQQQFYRWIDKHLGIAKNKMMTFVLEEYRTSKLNSISQSEEVDIELLVPAWWDDTVFEQLVQAVHDYIVNATLYEFFSIALIVPSRYGNHQDPATVNKQQEMMESLDEIKKLVNSSKPGRIRKPLKPF